METLELLEAISYKNLSCRELRLTTGGQAGLHCRGHGVVLFV